MNGFKEWTMQMKCKKEKKLKEKSKNSKEC